MVFLANLHLKLFKALPVLSLVALLGAASMFAYSFLQNRNDLVMLDPDGRGKITLTHSKCSLPLMDYIPVEQQNQVFAAKIELTGGENLKACYVDGNTIPLSESDESLNDYYLIVNEFGNYSVYEKVLFH